MSWVVLSEGIERCSVMGWSAAVRAVLQGLHGDLSILTDKGREEEELKRLSTIGIDLMESSTMTFAQLELVNEGVNVIAFDELSLAKIPESLISKRVLFDVGNSGFTSKVHGSVDLLVSSRFRDEQDYRGFEEVPNLDRMYLPHAPLQLELNEAEYSLVYYDPDWSAEEYGFESRHNFLISEVLESLKGVGFVKVVELNENNSISFPELKSAKAVLAIGLCPQIVSRLADTCCVCGIPFGLAFSHSYSIFRKALFVDSSLVEVFSFSNFSDRRIREDCSVITRHLCRRSRGEPVAGYSVEPKEWGGYIIARLKKEKATSPCSLLAEFEAMAAVDVWKRRFLVDHTFKIKPSFDWLNKRIDWTAPERNMSLAIGYSLLDTGSFGNIQAQKRCEDWKKAILPEVAVLALAFYQSPSWNDFFVRVLGQNDAWVSTLKEQAVKAYNRDGRFRNLLVSIGFSLAGIACDFRNLSVRRELLWKTALEMYLEDESKGKWEPINKVEMIVPLARSGKDEEVVELVEELSGVNSRIPGLYSNIGFSYFTEGRWDEALAWFEKDYSSDRLPESRNGGAYLSSLLKVGDEVGAEKVSKWISEKLSKEGNYAIDSKIEYLVVTGRYDEVLSFVSDQLVGGALNADQVTRFVSGRFAVMQLDLYRSGAKDRRDEIELMVSLLTLDSVAAVAIKRDVEMYCRFLVMLGAPLPFETLLCLGNMKLKQDERCFLSAFEFARARNLEQASIWLERAEISESTLPSYLLTSLCLALSVNSENIAKNAFAYLISGNAEVLVGHRNDGWFLFFVAWLNWLLGNREEYERVMSIVEFADPVNHEGMRVFVEELPFAQSAGLEAGRADDVLGFTV